jgi:hypothetical protein
MPTQTNTSDLRDTEACAFVLKLAIRQSLTRCCLSIPTRATCMASQALTSSTSPLSLVIRRPTQAQETKVVFEKRPSTADQLHSPHLTTVGSPGPARLLSAPRAWTSRRPLARAACSPRRATLSTTGPARTLTAPRAPRAFPFACVWSPRCPWTSRRPLARAARSRTTPGLRAAPLACV